MCELLTDKGRFLARMRRERFFTWAKGLIRDPLRPLAGRLGLYRRNDSLEGYLAFPKWPTEVRTCLSRMPEGFVTQYSMPPQDAWALYQHLLRVRPKAMLEVGCGISTVIAALVFERLDQRGTFFVSLDDGEVWLAKTSDVLDVVGLRKWVDIRHAPLELIRTTAGETRVHSAKPVAGMLEERHCIEPIFEFVLIDAPIGGIGRTGVLPQFARYIVEGAEIWLHDAAREGEQEAVRQWTEAGGLAALQGFLPGGLGIAVMRKNSARSLS